jgi:limonene-1,2-epoxide hydrolase
VSPTTRAVLEALVAARNAGSAGRAARLLSDDVRYWDPERGDVRGPDAVAAVMTARNARVAFETLADGGEDAVVELQVEEGGAPYRSTEVYRLAGGRVASVRAYFDPAARG